MHSPPLAWTPRPARRRSSRWSAPVVGDPGGLRTAADEPQDRPLPRRAAAGDAVPRRRSRRRRRRLIATLRRYLPLARIFYAVKANPAPEIVALLAGLGSSFDVASPSEIELCLDRGVARRADLVRQHDQEGARHRLRLSSGRAALRLRQRGRAREARARRRRARASSAASWSTCDGAEWPLSRKFGCAPEMAVELLRQARDAGARPLRRVVPCRLAADRPRRNGTARSAAAAQMFSVLAQADINLRMVNIGGGFPAHYRGEVAARRALCRGGDGGDHPAFRQRPARDHRRARPLDRRRCRRDPERGGADLAQVRRRARSAGSISTSASSTASPRRWTRASSTASARRRDGGAIRAGGARRARPATAPTSSTRRREYRLPLDLKVGDKVRDPVDRRLYLELCLGRLQRLRADQDLLHLKRRRRGRRPGRAAISPSSFCCIAVAKDWKSSTWSRKLWSPPTTYWS